MCQCKGRSQDQSMRQGTGNMKRGQHFAFEMKGTSYYPTLAKEAGHTVVRVTSNPEQMSASTLSADSSHFHH